MQHANIADAFGFGFDLHDVPPVARLAPLQLESARLEVTRAAAAYYESGTLKIPAQAYIIRASRES